MEKQEKRYESKNESLGRYRMFVDGYFNYNMPAAYNTCLGMNDPYPSIPVKIIGDDIRPSSDRKPQMQED